MLGLRQYRSTAIDLWCGDITSFSCDVIVNAADPSLACAEGVSESIHKIGGPTIAEECAKKRGCKPGKAILTGAGNLPAARLVHAVGPNWEAGQGEAAELLTSAYQEALKIVIKEAWQHVAFSALSTGANKYPLPEAAIVAVSAVKAFIDKKPPGTIRRVSFVLFDTPTYDVFQNALAEVFGIE